MDEFKIIENACMKAIEEYQFKDSLAFQVGYYKSQTECLCAEVEFLKQELETTIKKINYFTRI